MSEEKKENKNEKSKTSDWHGGKGSLERKGFNKSAYDIGWDRIFGKNKEPGKFDKQGTVHYTDGDNT